MSARPAVLHLVRARTGHCSSRSFIRNAASISVPTSTAMEHESHNIKREAGLPNPDPAADSASVNLARGHAPYMVPTYARPTPVLVKGEGCYVYDIENRRYLDFMAGIAVNALGHAEPAIAKILYEQSLTLMHTSNVYYNAWTGELSKLLVEKTRASGGMHNASRVFVSNSGSEANEAALKFARKIGHLRDPSGKKIEVVSFHGSFHGRTMGSLSATPNPKYQQPFAPMLPGFKYSQLNDESSVDQYITEATCGVIVEPIQGEGGVNIATQSFLEKLRRRCNEVGAVLIYDEIQCGMSRTGSLWAHSSMPASAHPDILTTAKALGNGYPVGATVVTEEIAESLQAGDHGSTFGGNPLACRIAHYMVSRLSDPELQSAVKEKEQVFRKGFAKLQSRFPELVGDVRGRGLLLGLQLTQDPKPIITAARERGLLVVTAGTNVLRFVPPLIISKEQIEEGLEILGSAMEAVLAGPESQ